MSSDPPLVSLTPTVWFHFRRGATYIIPSFSHTSSFLLHTITFLLYSKTNIANGYVASGILGCLKIKRCDWGPMSCFLFLWFFFFKNKMDVPLTQKSIIWRSMWWTPKGLGVLKHYYQHVHVLFAVSLAFQKHHGTAP
jgi:hypothetical protein